MAIANSFEKDAGVRFRREEISFLQAAAMQSKKDVRFSRAERAEMAHISNEYMAAVGNFAPEPAIERPALTERAFRDSAARSIVKVIDDQTLDFVGQGKWRLGTADYYRSIEKVAAKDPWEGFANLIFIGPKVETFFALSSGFNFGVLCATSPDNVTDSMKAKFGRHTLEIRDVRTFASRVMAVVGARRWSMKTVIYSDAKLVEIRTLQNRILRSDSRGNLDLSFVNDQVFRRLHSSGINPSLFLKPTRFADERELRLAFEFDHDLEGPIDFEDRELLKLIEIRHA